MEAAMMENALPVSALGEAAKGLFADVRRHGARVVVEDENPVGVLISAEEYEKMVDFIEDIRVEQIAAERIAHSTGKGITMEAYLKKHGMTAEDLEDVPEDEIG